MKYTLRTIK